MHALRPISILTLVFALALPGWSRSFRVGQVPNGSQIGCTVCHNSSQGGDARNPFGQLVERSFLSGGNVVWGPLLASLDADGDGVSNGTELQDRFGQWQTGQPNPGNPALVTAPGSVAANRLRTLTIQFTGMTPHVGQMLQLRVVDKSTRMEAERTTVNAISGAAFDLPLVALLDGRSYWVDFYVDFNGNGLYDPPPADHAWRLDVDNVSGNTSVPFAHNTSFTDIAWVYALTVSLTGMNPHIGQLFELRVLNQTSGLEVGRTRVEVLPSAAVQVMIPGIEVGPSYTVDMYADLNRNGRYDAPPSDNAWRLTFNNTTGDVSLNFARTTTFTDVQWRYLMQMNLLGMSPHLGQLFELRVTNSTGSEEIGRARIESIQLADFSVFVPGILRTADYRADFFADMNGDGFYNAPPADHAWRQAFSNTTGNVVLNFTHNTNFTDINWPGLAAEEPIAALLPDRIALDQNYPNPFNPVTYIRFDVVQSGPVSLDVFNLTGQHVAALVNGPLSAGSYNVTFDASGLPSGVYLYRLAAGGQMIQRKMMLLK